MGKDRRQEKKEESESLGKQSAKYKNDGKQKQQQNQGADKVKLRAA